MILLQLDAFSIAVMGHMYFMTATQYSILSKSVSRDPQLLSLVRLNNFCRTLFSLRLYVLFTIIQRMPFNYPFYVIQHLFGASDVLCSVVVIFLWYLHIKYFQEEPLPFWRVPLHLLKRVHWSPPNCEVKFQLTFDSCQPQTFLYFKINCMRKPISIW